MPAYLWSFCLVEEESNLAVYCFKFQPEQSYSEIQTWKVRKNLQTSGEGNLILRHPLFCVCGPGDRVYQHPCRCGDSYVLHQSHLAAVQSSIVVPCASCSNLILVQVPASQLHTPTADASSLTNQHEATIQQQKSS